MQRSSNTLRRLALATLLLTWVFVAGCGGSPSKPSTSTPNGPVATAAATAQSQAHAKGIYQFTGEKNPENAALPFLSGASLNFYWADLEPSKGQFNWNLIDTDMSNWTSHGKRVILRITTAGNNMNTPNSAKRTPQWVFDEGVPSVALPSGSVYPQYWNATWQSELRGFVQAFAARYDGNPNITYINVTTGNDGETIPIKDKNTAATPLIQSIGYTDALWFTTIQQIIGIYTSSFHKTALALQVDKTFIGKTPGYDEAKVLNYAASVGLWLQNDGLSRSTTLGPVWTQHPLAAEQGHSAASNGYPLSDDLQQAMSLNASYILVFASDINDAANQSALQSAAAHLGP